MPSTLPTKPKLPVEPEEVIGRVSAYLERLFSGAERVTERVKDRVADRIADRLADALTRRSSAVVLTEQEYLEYVETMEILEDPDAMAALAEAAKQPDSEARSYDEIRRELGLA